MLLLPPVAVLALALRFWFLGWGMPLRHAHIDESVVVFYTVQLLTGGGNHGVFFDYPGFFLYGLAAVFRGALWMGRLFAGGPGAAQAVEAYLQ